MTTRAKVKERPITMHGVEVLAILAGYKMQVRRVAKPPVKARFLPDDRWNNDPDEPGTAYLDDESGRLRITCPYGWPGDRLWVRESWWQGCGPTWGSNCVIFDADKVIGWMPGSGFDEPDLRQFRKRQSIDMPRWASRITLEITEVRLEQLQDICPEDVYREGIEEWGLPEQTFSPIVRFHELWDSINGKKHPWSGNPWVWAISFKVLSSS